ncbi:DUF1127 domain-containing protein [Rhizobium sp. S-51]|uniref:DUF1127 domain-containing protein n=1 Tax=Rhizobium terricola TaxID=2728849 RepID=A0A7Y0ATU1_9HYPH|nr:DUF1127 domain-containing protein [Rhizobium terricola]NML73391.1 DUF1127 domain-containing protein [Rhizobium terricola]
MIDSVAYLSAIDTIYPDGYQRETLFRSTGDMLSPAVRPKGIWARFTQGFSNWRMKRAGRLALSELTDEQLRDIGITRVAAEQEARKSWLLLR